MRVIPNIDMDSTYGLVMYKIETIYVITTNICKYMCLSFQKNCANSSSSQSICYSNIFKLQWFRMEIMNLCGQIFHLFAFSMKWVHDKMMLQSRLLCRNVTGPDMLAKMRIMMLLLFVVATSFTMWKWADFNAWPV